MEFKDNIECNKTIPSFWFINALGCKSKGIYFYYGIFEELKQKPKSFVVAVVVWVEDVEGNLKECTRKSNSCTDEFFFISIAHFDYMKRSKVKNRSVA